MNKNRKRRSYEILRKVLGVTLSLIMVLTTVFGGIGGSLMEKVGLGVDEAYAKEISKKNEQACDSCNRVKSGTAPDNYTTIPDGINVGSQSVYRGGSSFSGWADNFYEGYGLDTDPNDFAKPLPYGDVYIDTTKMKFEASNKDNFIIDIQDSRFKWISSGTPIKDAAYSDSDPTAHISTTDPMGQGRGVVGASSSIAYVGPLQSYLPDIKDAATNNGHTNDITPSGEYLYRITYKNAATLPNGTKGNVVITATRAQIETSITVDDTHPRVLSDENGEYSYNKALVVVHEANELAVVGGLKDSSGNYINEYDTVAKTAAEVQDQKNAAIANGAVFDTKDWNTAKVEDKYIVHATGVILDLEIKVVDGEGNPVEGTISYAAHDLDLQTSQNAWGRPVTTGTSEDTKFAEGMTIVSGAQSYALTPNYGSIANGLYYNSTSVQKDGWVEHGPAEAQPESPLLIEGGSDKTANGVRFSSRGIAAIRGVDGTFKDTPFNNAKDAGSGVNNGCVVLVTNQPYNRGGQIQNKDWYTKTDQSYRPNGVIRNLMLGKAKDDNGNLVTKQDDVNYKYIYNGVGNALWKTARNDNEKSFDTGFAVLLDAEKSEVQWSGSYGHSGSVRTRLFDTTVFTYIEQTHGTGGGIYLEDYKLHDDCEPVGREGVVTMGRGASATVTAVPEEGYRVKRFLIGGEGLTNSKEYTLENLGLTPGTHDTVTRDGITFEMNTDGTVDVGFAEVTDPRHVHVDFTADYYFYKVWKGDETPTKLELTAVPYSYIFTDVTLPAPAGTDPDSPYTDTKFSINGAEYTAADGTKYTLSPNNTLESNKKDGAGDPLVTLPYVLKGNSFVNETTGASYPVTIQFGVNFAMGDGTMDESKVKQAFTVKGTETGYVTVLGKDNDISNGNVVWKIKYPAEGVESFGWPALAIETEPAAHNVNHVERNYWFVTEKAPAGWSKEGYDNSKAEAPGVVPTIDDEYAGYYDNHVWAAASKKDYAAATTMIQQENKTKNAYMSVFSKDAGNTDKATYGGEISNVPAAAVKAEKTWVDFNNQFKTRQDVWLHIDARVDNVVTEDVLPPQKLAATGTDEKQTVVWGDLKAYETNQDTVKMVEKLADIPLQDEQGRRVTYTHASNGSYPASNGITYWLNELVKVDENGKTITYEIRETLDAAGQQPVEKDKEAEGLIGYTAKADKVTAEETSAKVKIDNVEVPTYEGKFKNELALTDFTVTKVWDDAPATTHGDGDAAKLKAAWTLYENDTEVADEGDLKLQPDAAEAYVKSGDDEVGTLETAQGSDTSGKVTTTFTWHNIPKYVGDGEEVREAEYSVKETQLENYEAPIYSGEGKALNEGTITNTQNPPTPKDDETWGLKGQEQTGEPSFEKGTADIDTIKLIDPATGKPTDEKTVDALDAEGNKIGTYTLNGDGTVTFKPNDDFVGDPQPAKLRATDKNGFEVDAEYQPHVIDDTETEDVSRTIHYIYSTDGSEASADVTQTATFTRKATGLDPDTHEPIWGDWELSSDPITDVTSPEIEGWNPSSELVTGYPDLTYDTKDQVQDVTVVYSPNPPEGSHKATFGPKGAVQKGTPPFTKGTGNIKKYELIDGDGNVVDALPAYDKDGNEVGTYTIDTETGEVTFTPTDPDFVGTATPATVRATDDLGETATGTYTPTTIENTETETVTKTITHVYEDGTPVLDEEGNPIVTTQTLTFSREGEVNTDTGEITWPNWETKTFDDWTAPDVEGYSPNKPASTGETVTATDDDIEDKIVYKRDTFTVIYTNGSNGKSDGKGNETGVPYGDNVKGGNTVTPDEGYKFTGKYTYTITKKDGTVETGETDNPTSVVVTGNVVFTPVYEKLPQVTYIDPATGRIIKVWTPMNDDGTEPPAPENPERPGFTFDGWDRTVDEETGNITYTAKWKAHNYTIKYDANGGSGTMASQKFTGEDNEAVSKTNEFTRDGYEFVGFKAQLPDGSYVKDTDGEDLVFATAEDFMEYFYQFGDGSEITLIAQWEPAPKTYWVTYIDPATGRTIMEKTTVNEGDDEPDPPADPERTGFTFDGWDRSVDSDGNITYTAKWVPATTPVDPTPSEPVDPDPVKTYWTTYVDPDGTTIYLEKTYKTVGAAEPPAPANPTKDGYTFDGWDREVDSDGNITYTARWVPVTTPVDPTPSDPVDPTPVDPTPVDPTPGEPTIWVRYIDGDGNEIYMDKTTFDQTVGEPQGPANPTKDGFVFDGWDRTVDSAGNITYIARWKPVSSTTPSQAKPATNVAKTGDQSNAGMWIGILAIAVLVALIAVLVRVRSKNK